MSDHLSLSTARPGQQMLLRGLLWAVLILFAVWFLLPAYVVVGTSMKELEEIRSGSLLALPHELNFTAWRHAWSEACIGVECTGLEPYFWNSVRMALPAVAIGSPISTCTSPARLRNAWAGQWEPALCTTISTGAPVADARAAPPG